MVTSNYFLIYLALCDIRKNIELLDSFLPEYLLNEQELKEYARMVYQQDKQRKIASRLLLHELLELVWPQEFSIKRLRKTTYLKPYIEGLKGISITHSGDYAAIAVSRDVEVGMDIQQYQKLLQSDMESTLTVEELKSFQSLHNNRQQPWFFDTWSKKEAILKAEGIGFGVEPTEICVLEHYGYIHPNRLWFFVPCPLVSGYALQVCASQKIAQGQVVAFRWHEEGLVTW